MAWRLGDKVVRGELDGSTGSHVRGSLDLVNGRRITLDLTGELQTVWKHFRFENPNHLDVIQPDWFDGFSMQQIGDALTMEMRMIRMCHLPRRSDDEETRIPALYLEWVSQNGIVVLELAMPAIVDVATGEGVDTMHQFSAGLNQQIQLACNDQAKSPPQLPFGLSYEKMMEEFERIDKMVESDGPNQVLLSHLFDPPLTPENAKSFETEQEAEQELNAVLDHLFEHNLVVDRLCDHLTDREAYDLLVNKVFPDQTHSADTKFTSGFTTHLCLYMYCPECIEESEMEFD